MKEELIRLLHGILPRAEFHVAGEEGTIAFCEYKDGYAAALSQPYLKHDGALPSHFLLAGVDGGRAPVDDLRGLVELLANALKANTDPQTGQVKFLFPDLGMYYPAPTRPDPTLFSEHVIRCAALHGIEETAELVQDIVDRKPLKCIRVIPLVGVALEEERIDIEPGAYLIQPDSVEDSLANGVPEELLITLPNLLHQANRPSWRKPVLLCIEREEDPVLEQPGEEPRDSKHRGSASSSVIEDPAASLFPSHLLVDAMSLTLGYPVDEMGYRWDCFDVKYVSLTGYQLLFLGRAWHDSSSRIHLKQEAWSHLVGLFGAIRARGAMPERLRIAFARWKESRRAQVEWGARPNVDAAIDLRVALETLFLDREDNGEYGFRLAVRGAWFLGDIFDRYEAFETLRKAYGYGSQAVHRGTIRHRQKDNPAAVLSQAQDICRHAITRQIYAGELQGEQWKRLVLQEPPEQHE